MNLLRSHRQRVEIADPGGLGLSNEAGDPGGLSLPNKASSPQVRLKEAFDPLRSSWDPLGLADSPDRLIVQSATSTSS